MVCGQCYQIIILSASHWRLTPHFRIFFCVRIWLLLRYIRIKMYAVSSMIGFILCYDLIALHHSDAILWFLSFTSETELNRRMEKPNAVREETSANGSRSGRRVKSETPKVLQVLVTLGGRGIVVCLSISLSHPLSVSLLLPAESPLVPSSVVLRLVRTLAYLVPQSE